MGRLHTVTLVLLALCACSEPRTAGSSDAWFSGPGDVDVTEPVAFTDVPYDFTGPTPLTDVPRADDASFETLFASSDPPPTCDGWRSSEDLPREVEGIVTAHPRYYFKTTGCQTPGFEGGGHSYEKYYGSYFVEDASGGFFVLGDSKVAHFDMGDRVRLRVRAVKESFGLHMIASHDVLEVSRGPEPIYYQVADGPLVLDDVGEVRRVTGTVLPPDPSVESFGELLLESDTGDLLSVGLDVELSRRGLTYEPGTRIEVTGPVIWSYDALTVVVMRVGQINVLAEATE